MEQQLDWTDANKKTARELRGNLAWENRKKGISPGRAMIAASDYIANTVMRPAKSGQEFDSWLNTTHDKDNRSHNVVAKEDRTNSTSYTVTLAEGLEPPLTSSRDNGGHTPLWNDAWCILRDAPLDKWIALQLHDDISAVRCQTSLNTHAKVKMNSVENGWKIRTKIDKHHTGVLWFIKRKLS